MTDPMTLVLGAMGAVILLSMLMMVLAARADHTLSEWSKVPRRDGLDAQIADKEAELGRLRSAIDARADRAAEAAAQERRLEELRLEWDQMADRRREVEALQDQTDTAQSELTGARAELAQAARERDAVRDELAEFRRLEGEVEALEIRRDELASALEALRRETADLEALRREAGDLRSRAEEARAEVARLEGLIQSREEAEAEARSARDISLMARSAAELEAAEARNEARALGERVRAERDGVETLAARRAFLEAEIARLEGSPTGDGETSDVADAPVGGVMSEPPALVALGRLPKAEPENEEAALVRVERHLAAIGLRYPRRVVRAFHTAMKVNDTAQMTVLSGISGTGKSQLPRRYAEAMGIGFLPVPVQPRWDSPQDLMGFYNYIEKRFRPTDMARALYHMDYTRADPSPVSERMLMVLLDEMNLARVEYYFSDFLSRLEGRPERERIGIDPTADSELELELRHARTGEPRRVFPGYNILFAGTMNEDESTQTLSDKVVDRANVMRFAAPDKIGAGAPSQGASRPALPGAMLRTRWDRWIRPPHAGGAVESPLQKMVDIMTKLERPFGYRLQGAIRAYVSNYPAETDPARAVPHALADQVEMRLLPKLRGLEVEQARDGLAELEGFVRDDLRDDVLADAVRRSVEAAEAGTGQFVWRGVARAMPT